MSELRAKAAGALNVVDAQVHGFYRHDGPQLLAVMDALGIQSMVIDEIWHHLEDGSSWPYQTLPNGVRRFLSPKAQGLAVEYPDRFSLVQRLNWRDPELKAFFTMLAHTPGCRGVRMNLKSREDRQALADGKVDPVFSLATQHGLAVCVLTHGQNAAELVASVAERFPDLRIVLDHCGNPKSAPQWDEVLRLSRLKNLWLKWSHPRKAFAPDEVPYADPRAQLLRAIAEFGASRLLWASDVTHEKSGATWSDLLHAVRDCADIGDDDKAWILGNTARQVFGWP